MLFFPHAVVPTNVPPIKWNCAAWTVLSVAGCSAISASGEVWAITDTWPQLSLYKVLKRPHTDYNNSSGITILPSCSSCAALLMSSSVILSTARLEVKVVENQSVMWLITVNTRAGHCRLLVCTVRFECIYLGRWESLFILKEATPLLPTAAEIRHVSLLLIQCKK